MPISLLAESLEIDPTSKTGLRWKKRPRKHFATESAWKVFCKRDEGNDAGTLVKTGSGMSFKVCVCRVIYAAHRIVYALAHGVDPGEMHIDHKDCNPLNNSVDNLRLATMSENQMNQRPRRAKSGQKKGVHYRPNLRKWATTISINRKKVYLGVFSDYNEAVAAYEKAAMELHGEFARFE